MCIRLLARQSLGQTTMTSSAGSRSSWCRLLASTGTVLGLTLLAACGGGSSDDDNRNVSGVWRGALTLIQNDCNLDLASTLNATHTVNRNGDAVILINESEIQHLGNLVGDDGFSVNALLGAGEPVGELVCDLEQQIEYDGINGDQATVDISITRECRGFDSPVCETSYRGAVTRSDGAIVPAPQPTPTEVADGIVCSAVLERSYSGDGGCGLSTTAVRQNGGTLILEPFGSNGATSFTTVQSDLTQAESSRTDLEINGLAGYSCAIQCNGELTFVVGCFLEGGTSCSEKF